jgi:putative ABC transport system substrate-binding protein
LPAIYTNIRSVAEGGLIGFAADQGALVRRTAAIIDRILKGAKPADLPVERPTRYELAVNLKTAKALGITFPQSLLLRADEIIQ